MKITILFFTGLLLFITFSCKETPIPKPRGYFRIDFPEKSYNRLSLNYPYSFEYPSYSKIEEQNPDSFWVNISISSLKAKIHISYKNVNNNIEKYLNESNALVYKHSIKADAINEEFFFNEDKKVYGALYNIKGNAASSLQFHLTDSTKHFLRGSLYFYVVPNKDSLHPVINFIKEDIIHLIETFEWQ